MYNIFSKDHYRFYKNEKKRKFLLRFKRQEYIYIYYFRKCQSKSIFRFYYKFMLKKYSNKTKIQIPDSTRIGEGFFILHNGRVIINPSTIIGKNFTVSTGVVIGKENRGSREGCPVIGDDVYIGANSVLVGNIKIGNNVLIAPLTFVNFNVPNDSIVIGNPARIIHNSQATEKYIQNKI